MTNEVKQFLKDFGYPSLSAFSDALGEDITNVSKIVQGKQKPKIEKMFHWASILDCDIVRLLYIFYPAEMNKNEMENHRRERK